eukprot:TRINITY_DN25094_c0_g1_i1.p1 TRINITY_DN25094_c0_g1~~TRINITY_DN25094_c0_g1_i1.p1  ORF type:complete len:1532 (+),score=437.64 TRINITY_DN25094_c0_g1_i1:149-4744(+)
MAEEPLGEVVASTTSSPVSVSVTPPTHPLTMTNPLAVMSNIPMARSIVTSPVSPAISGVSRSMTFAGDPRKVRGYSPYSSRAMLVDGRDLCALKKLTQYTTARPEADAAAAVAKLLAVGEALSLPNNAFSGIPRANSEWIRLGDDSARDTHSGALSDGLGVLLPSSARYTKSQWESMRILSPSRSFLHPSKGRPPTAPVAVDLDLRALKRLQNAAPSGAGLQALDKLASKQESSSTRYLEGKERRPSSAGPRPAGGGLRQRIVRAAGSSGEILSSMSSEDAMEATYNEPYLPSRPPVDIQPCQSTETTPASAPLPLPMDSLSPPASPTASPQLSPRTKAQRASTTPTPPLGNPQRKKSGAVQKSPRVAPLALSPRGSPRAGSPKQRPLTSPRFSPRGMRAAPRFSGAPAPASPREASSPRSRRPSSRSPPSQRGSPKPSAKRAVSKGFAYERSRSMSGPLEAEVDASDAMRHADAAGAEALAAITLGKLAADAQEGRGSPTAAAARGKGTAANARHARTQRSLRLLERVSYDVLRRRYWHAWREWKYVRRVRALEQAALQVVLLEHQGSSKEDTKSRALQKKRTGQLARQHGKALQARYYAMWQAWHASRATAAVLIQAGTRGFAARKLYQDLQADREHPPGPRHTVPLHPRLAERWRAANRIQAAVRGHQGRRYVDQVVRPRHTRAQTVQGFVRSALAARVVAGERTKLLQKHVQFYKPPKVESPVVRAGSARGNKMRAPSTINTKGRPSPFSSPEGRPLTAKRSMRVDERFKSVMKKKPKEFIKVASTVRDAALYVRFGSGLSDVGRTEASGWFTLSGRVVNARPVWMNAHGVRLCALARPMGVNYAGRAAWEWRWAVFLDAMLDGAEYTPCAAVLDDPPADGSTVEEAPLQQVVVPASIGRKKRPPELPFADLVPKAAQYFVTGKDARFSWPHECGGHWEKAVPRGQQAALTPQHDATPDATSPLSPGWSLPSAPSFVKAAAEKAPVSPPLHPTADPAGLAVGASSLVMVPWDGWAVYLLQAAGRGLLRRVHCERMRRDLRVCAFLEKAQRERMFGVYFRKMAAYEKVRKEQRRMEARVRRRQHVGALMRKNALIFLRRYRQWFVDGAARYRRKAFLAGAAHAMLSLNRPIYARYYNHLMRFIYDFRCARLREATWIKLREEYFHRLLRFRVRRKYYRRVHDKCYLRFRKQVLRTFYSKLAVWAPITAFSSYEGEHRAYIVGKETQFAAALHVAHQRITENWVAYRDSLLRLSLKKMWEGNILKVMKKMWDRLADFAALKAMCRARRVRRGRELDESRHWARFLPKANGLMRAFMQGHSALREQEAKERAGIEKTYPQLKAMQARRLFAPGEERGLGGSLGPAPTHLRPLNATAPADGPGTPIVAVEHHNVFSKTAPTRSPRWETGSKWSRGDFAVRASATPPRPQTAGTSFSPLTATPDSRRGRALSDSSSFSVYGSPTSAVSPGGRRASGSPVIRLPTMNKRKAATYKDYLYSTGASPSQRTRPRTPDQRRRDPGFRTTPGGLYTS